MIETSCCDDKDQLVAFLYDEIDPVSRRRVEEHLRVCTTCAAEIREFGEVRHALAKWQPPDAVLDVTIPVAEGGRQRNGSGRPVANHDQPLPESKGELVRPARWWTRPALPAWAQAAAAVLVVATGLAIANLQVRYDTNGLVVTTGWMTPTSPAAAPSANGAVMPVSAPATSEDWRTAMASLERELRGEIQSARAAQPTLASLPSSRNTGAASMERVSELIEESEQRQKRELALRLTQVVRDIELQRRTDNRRNVQAIGQFEGLAGAEMLRQRQALDYIMRVSTQPPPQ
jgi:hypothetical protein